MLKGLFGKKVENPHNVFIPGVIGIPRGDEWIDDFVAVVMNNAYAGKSSRAVRVSINDLLASAATAAFGFKNDGVDLVTGLARSDVVAAFRASIPAGTWAASISNIYSGVHHDVFVLHDISTDEEVEWIHAMGGLVYGSENSVVSVDCLVEYKNIKQLVSVLESPSGSN